MCLVLILVVGMFRLSASVTPVMHRHSGHVLVPRLQVAGDESEGSGESGDGDQQLTSEPAFQPTTSPDRYLRTISEEKSDDDDDDDFSMYIVTEETKDFPSTTLSDFTERPSTTIASITPSKGYISTIRQRTVPMLSSKRTSRDNRGRELNSTKEERNLCPGYCCSSNVTCRYDYEVIPVCSCNKGSPYETCELSNGDNPIWADVLKMASDKKRGVCMEFWDRDKNNITRYRLHCHVTGIQDFTYTSDHWNASSPDDLHDKNLPNQRPCLMFIKRAGPPLRNKTAMDETLQYAGFAMIFVFIGVIMCSCRNSESSDGQQEPLERKASDAWVDS